MFTKFLSTPNYDADKGGAGGAAAGDPPVVDQQTWEAWLATQSTDVQKMFDEHVSGLKSALISERDKAKTATQSAKRLAELEEAEKKRKESELSESEKAKAQLAELQAERDKYAAQLTSERIRHAVLQAAAKDFTDPEDAYLLADLSEVVITKDGNVEGVDEALKALLKKKPHLAIKPGQISPDIDATRRGTTNAPNSEELKARKRENQQYSGI